MLLMTANQRKNSYHPSGCFRHPSVCDNWRHSLFEFGSALPRHACRL